MSVKKSLDLHKDSRIKAAERAAEEFGSFAAFVRLALDEYDEESRLEGEIAELQEQLESKQERLEELREEDTDEEPAEQGEDVPDELKEFYTADDSSGES